jgi:hypothetical protein
LLKFEKIEGKPCVPASLDRTAVRSGGVYQFHPACLALPSKAMRAGTPAKNFTYY